MNRRGRPRSEVLGKPFSIIYYIVHNTWVRRGNLFGPSVRRCHEGWLQPLSGQKHLVVRIPRLAHETNRWAMGCLTGVQNTHLYILHSTGRQGTRSVGTHLKYSTLKVAVSIQEFLL